MIPLSLHTSLPPPPPPPPPPPTTNPKIPSLNFSSTSPPRRRRFARRCRRTGWDSNAEWVRTGRFGFRDGDVREEDGRKWWSDEPDEEFDDEFDDEEEEEEDFWDKIWIFKVFKAYGYMLPAIIASMLLATGPKAFLMALALPLGQSAISLAIDKLWGRRTYEEPRMKAKYRRKPFNRSTSFTNREKEERKSNYKGRNDYHRSWDSAAESEATDNASGPRSTFGGWDELDDDQKGSAGRKSSSGDGDEPVKKGKLSRRRGRYRDAPLFLRLLIAVFPFLGSWTRIL